jgi:hypothetical protein
LSGIFCVSQFAYVANPLTDKKSVKVKPCGIITSNLRSATLFSAMGSGLKFSTVECLVTEVLDAGEFVHNAICHPGMCLLASASCEVLHQEKF